MRLLTRMKKMTDRLWFRLTAAFALVIGVGVVVTVVVARQGTATQFAHFMINKHMIRPEQLQTVLVDAYAAHNGWTGIQAALPALIDAAADGQMSGMMGNMMGMHNNSLNDLDGNWMMTDFSDSTCMFADDNPNRDCTFTMHKW